MNSEGITEYVTDVGVSKSNTKFLKGFLLAFMGGMFIALASIGSIIGTCTITSFSVASVVAGIIFGTGLMMVVIAGGDLYTGNVLIIISVMRGKSKALKMLLNLAIAFLGNLVGSMFIVLAVHYSGILTNANGAIVAKVISKAAHKLELSFMEAFLLGILCNLLVCIAVWMMYSAKDTGGKVLACLFPIMLFILSGYEHIVANMYYIPAGILAAANPEYFKLSGASAAVHEVLKAGNIYKNFIPVLLGNTVGGSIIGAAYAIINKKAKLDFPVGGSGLSS